MPKCDFNKVALTSEHLFLRTPLGGCFWILDNHDGDDDELPFDTIYHRLISS